MSDSLAHRQHAVKSRAEIRPASSAEIPARSAAGEACSALVVQIFRLNGLITSAGDALAAPAGQTSARWRVLAAIDHEPETVARIARRWGQARQSVQRVANELVRDGLASYTENPKHRRAQLLVLTPTGRSALQAIQAAQVAWANRLGEQIGAPDLRQAIEILSKIIALKP